MLKTRAFLVVFFCSALLVLIHNTTSGQQQQPPSAPVPPVLENYQPVTAERLKNPEDGNWLMIRRTYEGWGYSPLDQITSSNVTRLRPVWVFSTAEARVHEAAPIVWTHNYPKSPNWGSMLATGGGLVFSGGTSDRKFHAFDASTGNLLWEFPTNSGILAPPSSFTIDGKQYIAVLSGWGGDSRGMQATLNRLFPGEFPEVPEGGAVWLFTID